jgi:type IV secretory pathway VirB6-like protein
MKKLLTLLFAAALTLSLSSVSFAQDAGSADKKDDAKTETKADKKASKKAKKSKKEKTEKTDDMKKDDMAK